jgi:hypothetical protein
MAVDWLTLKTGKGKLYWYNRIGELISKHAYWGKDKVHQEVNIEELH